MSRSFLLLSTRPAAIALVAAASVALLAGCTGATPEPSESATPPSASTSETPVASAEPTETAEPPVPFAIACDALLTPDQVYEFNPNFGAAPDYAPEAAGVVAVVDAAGTACGWLNQTSGEIIEVGVATPPPAVLDARKNDAALGSNPVPTYGTPPAVEGYFGQTAGRGQAQIFTGPYWIVIESTALFEPGDAGQLVSAVLGNLPAA